MSDLPNLPHASALEPFGPAAEVIADLWWFMFILCTGIFLLVVALLAVAVFKGRREGRKSPPLGDTGFIVLGGIVMPFGVILVLLVYALTDTVALTVPETKLTIQVTGHMWWWDVRYPDQGIVLANELYIPTDEPVRIELISADVIHSFWVPSLSGKTDLLPGQKTVHWLEADRPGVYRGACAEYCGLQHARMAFHVIALPPEEFQAWVRARQAPSPKPMEPRLAAGLEVFLDSGCAECHAIGGTDAAGDIGPDLTHVGSRRYLGAGTLPNNHGNLAGWILNPKPLKPGNKMPATYLEPEELEVLVLYLRSLQ